MPITDEQIQLVRNALAGTDDEARVAFELIVHEYRQLLAEKTDK
jgi:hypothetical protein